MVLSYVNKVKLGAYATGALGSGARLRPVGLRSQWWEDLYTARDTGQCDIQVTTVHLSQVSHLSTIPKGTDLPIRIKDCNHCTASD